MKPELTTDELETLIERIIQTGKTGLKGTEVFEAFQLKAYIQDEISSLIEKGLAIPDYTDSEISITDEEIENMEKLILEFYDEVFNLYPEILYDTSTPNYSKEIDRLYHSILTTKDIHVLAKVLNFVDDFIKDKNNDTPFEIGHNEIHFKSFEDIENEKSENPTIEKISFKIDTLIQEIDNKRQWESIFYEEQDYSKYKDLLIQFFTDESFKIPKTTIITRPRTVAKVSSLLKGLHEQFSELRGHLKKDTRFHGIVRILHEWKNKNSDQIYKAIYKG